ncbi:MULTISPECIES: ABC transporter permease [unclassified Modestobacter]|uniref:ABC transporter permease n=1 Tax=unclassified Modestobacter TaxID=2643866 RepID=UPI0022AA9A84|nr:MULTISPECIES: ABC transporter permease subunit [unclassified Modestobacter]MCZ2814431.1 ABC transporter permease subunit [Modestobacter sp. VKM Ac-2979]MCZ2844757.1 ABC transporter permease subunit [Modestobacter sp. VKM Ac-2980]MCZ2850551.1 ABC transporter permease subunit [Modestobacter sp. VKM Ac-2978]
MHLSRESIRSLRTGAVGILALVAVWWLAALTVLSGARVPTPDGVLTTAVEAGWGFWSLHFGMTLQEASVGFLYGTLAGLVVASLVLLFPVAEPVLMQVAVMSYCVPLVAIAPVLFIVIGNPDEGERSGTATALAALAVFFTTVVGTVLGLRSADRASLDVVRVFGGGRVRQLQKVQLISALPSILAAMRIGAPAAFLGAILGEYVGGVQRGVALILKIAQQNVDVEQAWAVGIGCALMAGTVYAVLGLVGRVVTPWSKGAAS